MSLLANRARIWKNLATRSSYWHTIPNSKLLLSVVSEKVSSVKYKHSLHSNVLSNFKNQLPSVCCRQIHFSLNLKEREHFRQSESASYEGTGKTTVTILNEDVQYIMIDAFSLGGFRLNNGMQAFGPMVVFPNAVLSWRVMDFLEVNERTLSLFTIIEPKPDIVIIGYGDRPIPVVRSPRLGYDMNDEEKEKNEMKYLMTEKRNKEIGKHIAKLTLIMKQKKLTLECLPTEDAISAYNYLVSEDRLVAAALIPPNVVKMVSEDTTFSSQLDHGDDPWHVKRDEIFGSGEQSTIQPLKDWYNEKKEDTK